MDRKEFYRISKELNSKKPRIVVKQPIIAFTKYAGYGGYRPSQNFAKMGVGSNPEKADLALWRKFERFFRWLSEA